MNADYPANPAAPGSHPFPGVTQAVPQGAGGPEQKTHSQPASGGHATHPGAPSVPPPSPYASPAGTTAAPVPPSPAQHSAPQTTGQPSAPAVPHSTQHSTQHATTQHSTTQPTTQPDAAPGAAPVAPLRRASLRTGTQPVTAGAGATSDGAPESKKKFGLFGKKSEATEPSGTTATLRRKGGPRKVRAMMTAIDPWSVMKMSFLTSIATGIALVVAVSVVWGVLNQMGVFTSIQEQVTTLFAVDSETKILAYFEYSKIMSGTILVAVFNVILVTALGTVGALIYNVIAKLVGGVYVTLSDD